MSARVFIVFVVVLILIGLYALWMIGDDSYVFQSRKLVVQLDPVGMNASAEQVYWDGLLDNVSPDTLAVLTEAGRPLIRLYLRDRGLNLSRSETRFGIRGPHLLFRLDDQEVASVELDLKNRFERAELTPSDYYRLRSRLNTSEGSWLLIPPGQTVALTGTTFGLAALGEDVRPDSVHVRKLRSSWELRRQLQEIGLGDALERNIHPGSPRD